ncbi:MAG: hypothetical protein IJV06_06680 [Bacteroidaceae bacterium]|nr:hypothetical protein [Bacteroidaceae bacterium]
MIYSFIAYLAPNLSHSEQVSSAPRLLSERGATNRSKKQNSFFLENQEEFRSNVVSLQQRTKSKGKT